MKKSDPDQFEREISIVEESFIKLGAERMSKYFGVKNFKNRISSEHILWIQGNNGYFHIKAKRERRTILIIVQYGSGIDQRFEDFSHFTYTDDENRLKELINGIIHGVLPEDRLFC